MLGIGVAELSFLPKIDLDRILVQTPSLFHFAFSFYFLSLNQSPIGTKIPFMGSLH